jgi:hypothetical protein
LLVLDAVASELQCVGVGSIAAALRRTEPSGKRVCHELLVRGGMAGSSLPSTEASRFVVSVGDMLVAATDGLRAGFIDGLGRADTLRQLAEQLLATYWTAQDDALVVVARIQGSPE